MDRSGVIGYSSVIGRCVAIDRHGVKLPIKQFVMLNSKSCYFIGVFKKQVQNHHSNVSLLSNFILIKCSHCCFPPFPFSFC